MFKQKYTQLNPDGSFKLSSFRKWIALILIGLGGGTIYIVPYLFNSYLAQVATVTGSSAAQLSTLITAYGALSVIFYIPGGWLADRVSARTLFSLSLVGTGIVSLWYSLLPFGFVDYAQLVIIHLLLAVTTVLTFWSAFVKAVKLLGPDSEQASLYSKCDFLRNTFGVVFSFLTIAFFTVALPFFIEQGEAQKEYSGLFLTILLYGIIYIIAGVASWLVLPVQQKEKKVTKKFGENKQFWAEQWKAIVDTLKQPAIYMIGLLILFTMNIFQTIGGVGQFFLIANGIDATTASTMQIVFFYVMPILGAIIFGLVATKLTKNSAKTISIGAIGLLILGSIIAILIATTNNQADSTIGWTVAGLIIVVTLIIGGTRAIMWSTMTETKIPVHLYGMAVGIISIIGFNNDIWLRLFLFSPIFSPDGEIITNDGFTNIFIWVAVNAVALIGIAIVIFMYSKKKSKISKIEPSKKLSSLPLEKKPQELKSELKPQNDNIKAIFNARMIRANLQTIKHETKRSY